MEKPKLERKNEISVDLLRAYLKAKIDRMPPKEELELYPYLDETALEAYKGLYMSLGAYKMGHRSIEKEVEEHEKATEEAKQQIDDIATDLLPGADSRGSGSAGPKPGLLYPPFPNGEHGQANTCTRPENDRPRPTEKGKADQRKAKKYQVRLFLGGQVATLTESDREKEAESFFTKALKTIGKRAKGWKNPPFVLFLVDTEKREILKSGTNAAFQ